MFTETAGQIAGQLGQVVELTDPELSDEWVVVRFGKDELPFSPADLIIAPKTAAQRRSSTATPVPAPREEAPVTPPAPSVVDVEIPAPPGKNADANGSSGKGAAANAAAGTASANGASPNGASPNGADGKRPVPAKKAGKPKAPAELSITVTYGDGEWLVAATQGAKTLAKPYVIKPAEALKMVALLDAPMVHDAVEEIVNAARQEAEDHAEKLRAQLAEIEAKLAELRDAG
jgi:hypothetical protein